MDVIATAESNIAKVLSQLCQADWAGLRLSAAKDARWHQLIWWHNKYYRANDTNDGSKLQMPRKGVPEIPYERELFYPSPDSRFSLGDKRGVAYFSSDLAVNCCETIEQFSESPELSLKDLLDYGGGNPTPGWHGYPLNFHLSQSAVVLDLSSEHSLFFDYMDDDQAQEIWSVIGTRDVDAKRYTQLIARAVDYAGFDGITPALMGLCIHPFEPRLMLLCQMKI
jgi:hypothetical protein